MNLQDLFVVKHSNGSLLMQIAAMFGVILLLLYFIVRIVCSWRTPAGLSAEQIERNWEKLMKEADEQNAARRAQVRDRCQTEMRANPLIGLVRSSRTLQRLSLRAAHSLLRSPHRRNNCASPVVLGSPPT